jgi:outer membrane immunogenic protein
MQKGTMRSLLVGLVSATVFSGAAIAADMARPVYKAPPAGVLPVAYDWTGFYIGGHVGYGWAEKDWRDAFGLNVSNKGNGFLGGGQVGFNYQINQFVLGVEGDFSWSGINGGTTIGPTSPRHSAARSTRRELGLDLDRPAGLAFDRWLVYAKGGVAWANDSFSTNRYTLPATVEVKDTRSAGRWRRRRIRVRACLVCQARI